MTTNYEHLIAIVETIQQSKEKNKVEYFANQYANFKEKYPHLYQTACATDKIDMNNLKYMISMMKKMEETNLSQFDASAKVGKMLYDKYIHDQIKDLPPTK
jgi:tellurite resistance protein